MDSLIDQLSCTGDLNSVDEQIDKLKVFASGGFTEIALRVHDDPYASIQLIGEQVAPALREIPWLIISPGSSARPC